MLPVKSQSNFQPQRFSIPPRRPLKQRVYPAMRMTIALGVLCSDGIVLAADSEESTGYAGGVKTSSVKIATGISGAPIGYQVSAAISGAGRARYLDSAKDCLIMPVLGTYADNYDAVKASIDGSLGEFYAKHVIPFASLPDHDRPEISLIIARQCAGQLSLWTTDKNTVQRCFKYGAVGAGAAYATLLLSRYIYPLNIAQGKMVAAHTIFRVKEAIEGCGKRTDILSLRGGQAQYMPLRDVERLEQLFEEWANVEAGLFHYVMGHEGLEPNSSKRVASWLKSMRKDLAPFANSTTQRYLPRPTDEPLPPPPSPESSEESGES